MTFEDCFSTGGIQDQQQGLGAAPIDDSAKGIHHAMNNVVSNFVLNKLSKLARSALGALESCIT